MTTQTRIDLHLRVSIHIESNTVNVRISIRGRPHDYSSKIRDVFAVFLPRPFTCSTLCSCSFT